MLPAICQRLFDAMHADLPARPDPRPWRAHLIGTALIELQRGNDSCLVNVDWAADQRPHRVHASEAQSPWFPDLFDRLHELVRELPGRYVLV